MTSHIFLKELLLEVEKKNLPKTMIDHIKRLQSMGGKIIGEITKDHEIGYIGINGTGKSAVKFAFYPDHTYDRLEKGTKIRPGWSDINITDLDMIAKNKAKAEKLDRSLKKEMLFSEKIRVSDAEMNKICKDSGISLGGEIEDMWPEEDGYVKVGGKEVAKTTYSVTIRNPEYAEDDPDGDQDEFYDPVSIVLIRDEKDPKKIHAKDY